MIYLAELPVMLFLIYPNYEEILWTFCIYLVCCTLLQRNIGYLKNIGICKYNFHFILAEVIIILLGWVAFVINWHLSYKVALIANFLNIPSNAFIMIIATIISIMSLPGIYIIFSIIHNAYKKDIVKNVESKSDTLGFRKKDYIFCLVVALITSLQFQLRPFANLNPGVDQSVFLYIGRMMHQGFVPYKDLFDHKGIILYLIQYIGMFWDYDKFLGAGVWFVEVLNMWLFDMAIIKISKLLTDSKNRQYITLCLISIFGGRVVYEGGNLVQEYALPWIAISLYIFLKYFIRGNVRQRDIVLLGSFFSIVFFLQSNMIAVWIAFIPFVVVGLIYGRQWRLLIKYIILFIFGCCIVLFPIIFYALYTDCIKWMIEYYFKYNLNYTDSYGTFSNRISTIIYLAQSVRIAIPAIVVTGIVYGKNKIYIMNSVYFILTLVMSSISGRRYAHYGIVLLPAIIFFVVYFIEIISQLHAYTSKMKDIGNKKIVRLNYVFVILTFAIIYTVIKFPFTLSLNRVQSPVQRYILDNTDKDDDILIIGNQCINYLVTNRNTGNKFFYTSAIEHSQILEMEFMEELYKNKSSVIIFPFNRNTVENGTVTGRICDYLDVESVKGTYTYENCGDFFVYVQGLE
jgi:hypothetical protein